MRRTKRDEPSVTLTDRVAEAIRGEIVRGACRPGEALPREQAIAETYGVSRTVTREAISRLKAEGIVTVRRGVGVFVSSEAPFKPFRIDSSFTENVDSILDIIELRSGIEMKATELAAARRKRSHLIQMDEALNAIDVALEAGDISGSVDADHAFHVAIYSATGNAYYTDFFQFIGQYFRRVVEHNRMYASGRGGRDEAQREHREIFEAIVDQDSVRAVAAAKLHIDSVARRIHRSELNLDRVGAEGVSDTGKALASDNR